MLTQGTGGLVADEEMRAPGARSGRGGACGRLAGLSCEYRPIATSPRPFCGSETSYIATPACPVARPYWWRSVNPIMCNVTVVSYGNCNAVASATGSGRSEFHDLAVMRSREDASLGDCGTISFIRDAADQTEPFRPAPPDAVGYRTAASAPPRHSACLAQGCHRQPGAAGVARDARVFVERTSGATSRRRDVAADSDAETACDMHRFIDSRPGVGVPFCLRSRECLSTTATEVLVRLKLPLYRLYGGGWHNQATEGTAPAEMRTRP